MQEIEYAITRSARRKTVSIIIRANNQVDVLAPKLMPSLLINRFVQEKRSWIDKKLQYNQTIRANYQPKIFAEDEYFDLLGKSYQLKFMASKITIHLNADKLITPPYQPDKLKKSLAIWYRKQAEQYFQKRCQEIAVDMAVSPASIAVKAYKSRWGSCHHDGRIYFNWRLIMAPVWVIDYVIVHELCHLIHHNHSTYFWQKVEEVMPDYKQAKEWLKINGMMLDL